MELLVYHLLRRSGSSSGVGGGVHPVHRNLNLILEARHKVNR